MARTKPDYPYTPQVLEELAQGATGTQIFFIPTLDQTPTYLRLNCWGPAGVYWPKVPGIVRNIPGEKNGQGWWYQKMNLAGGLSYGQYEEWGATEDRVVSIARLLPKAQLLILANVEGTQDLFGFALAQSAQTIEQESVEARARRLKVELAGKHCELLFTPLEGVIVLTTHQGSKQQAVLEQRGTREDVNVYVEILGLKTTSDPYLWRGKVKKAPSIRTKSPWHSIGSALGALQPMLPWGKPTASSVSVQNDEAKKREAS